MPQTRPEQVWNELEAGNARFAAGEAVRPHQDAARLEELAQGQSPSAVVFCCSDSRVAPEIFFDQGLGDMFTVRNAGHVASESAIGSLEYAVGPLAVPLLVVVVHESCGAVAAAVDAVKPDAAPLPPAIDSLVQQIVPSVRDAATAASIPLTGVDPASAGRAHVRRTISQILEKSEMISAGVADGTLGIVGARYTLADGRVRVETAVGIDALTTSQRNQEEQNAQ